MGGGKRAFDFLEGVGLTVFDTMDAEIVGRVLADGNLVGLDLSGTATEAGLAWPGLLPQQSLTGQRPR